MTSPSQSSDPSPDSKVNLNISFQYYDYGSLYGEDKINVSGLPRDLGLLLGRLSEDGCFRFSVMDDLGHSLSPEDLKRWARTAQKT